jgi:beta-lactamase class A
VRGRRARLTLAAFAILAGVLLLPAAARAQGPPVTDLQTGETIAVNGDHAQLAACSINFVLLFQVVADLQAGRYARSTVDNLVARTLYSSNPVTAHDLYGIVGDGDVLAGARRVADRIRALGLEHTVLDHPPGYPEESLHPNPYDWNNWMTARDANAALAALYSGGELSPGWREYLLSAMTVVKPGLNYLTAVGPEPAALVSHKNGFAPTTDGQWIDNDIGIVRFQRGDRVYAYAISFFSQWVPERYADIPLGEEISAAAWQYFSHRYP